MNPLVRIAVTAALIFAAPAISAEPTAAEVFEKRIAPIFKSPNPSSCVQCHLSGVDLKDYILLDADKTFRSLRDQGLIDLAAPERSKIVKLIDMGGDTKGPTVHEKNRKAEREAFVAWIAACAADPKLKESPKLNEKELAKPPKSVEVIRHARKDQMLEAFEANVWAWRFRCMNCHTEGTPQNAKLVKEHGERVAWVKKDGSAATMDYLLASKLIDPAKSEDSPLLRKPLGDDKHGGGVKFAVGDDAYKGFRSWIEDVAAIKAGKYAAAKDLPKTAAVEKFGTDVWFKLENCPPAWGDKFLQVRLFAWDEKAKGWEADPIAVSDRMVFGKGKLWQHNLTILAAKGSEREKGWRAKQATLPDGRYLVKVYMDAGGRLAKDWTATLGDDDFAGQAEFRAKWKEGYGGMTAVDAGGVRR